MLINASSTLAAVFAEVSIKMRPCSLAKASPSSLFTSRLASRSLERNSLRNLRPLCIDGKPGLPFVPDEHDDHVAVAVLPGVLQPGGQVVEGVPPGDVVHQQGPGSSAVVGPGDGAEGFLSSLEDCRLTAGLV